MAIRIRTVGTTALVLAGTLALCSCTATEPPPTTEYQARTSSPEASLTVVADASEQAASIATSVALFDESRVVVVAPAGDPAAQALAARAAVAVGVPLLVADGAGPGSSAAPGEVDAALRDEFTRLNVTTVWSIGDPAGFAARPGSSDSADDAADNSADDAANNSGNDAADGSENDPADGTPRIVASDATQEHVEAALGFALDAEDGAAGTPGTADRNRAAAIPRTTPAPPLDDTLALALDSDAQIASIATAQAAGVAVQLLPTSAPNPQANAAAVEALHGSATSKTLAIGAAFGGEPELDWKIRASRTGATLPGGGQLLFPQHQFIALYGTPGTPSMGVLGEQDVAAAIQRAKDVAAPYAGLTDKTVVPMFEIIATVASASAGADGNYSNELDPARLRPWIDAAAAEGVYVVLDLQPGRTDFLTQAKQYQELLELPNVGLAIDPEWRLAPDQVHLKQVGGVDAVEVNAVTAWLAELTNEKALPQKMLVLHQFRQSMLRDRSAIDMSHPELAMLIHADGLGAQPDKQATWRALHQDAPAGVAWGWKNFYDEDAPMLNPEQTVAGVFPVPDLVTYQ
ncbi:hypothetical protein [Glaciihabitans tibetensis]|nr:hypothetical protein [Glaciihabitans tibetensis]